MSIGEKPFKLNKKARKKTRDLIDKKLSKLDKKAKKKTDHLLLYRG